MIEIKTVEFVKGIVGTDTILEDPKPQIAFVGRSNVGKSSVLNSIFGKRELVKTSSTPGKTKEINYFLVDDKYYFVDLPGYGFAKLPEKARQKLRKLIIWYLTYSGVSLKKVAIIIDAKIGITKFDEEMINLLKENNYDILIVANKIDKLKQKEFSKQSKTIKEKSGANDVCFYSAKTKKGKDELLEKILKS